MNIEQWFHNVTGGESQRSVAQKINIQQSKLSRQISAGNLDPEIIRDIARVYGVKPVDAFLETGFLTEGDTALVGVELALGMAKNSQILGELNRRVDPEGRRLYRGEGQDVIDVVDDAEVFDFPAPTSTSQEEWRNYAVADESPDHDEEDTDFD